MTTDLLSVHPWAAAAPDRVRFGVETLAMPDWGETRAFVQASDGAWSRSRRRAASAVFPAGLWLGLATCILSTLPLC